VKEKGRIILSMFTFIESYSLYLKAINKRKKSVMGLKLKKKYLISILQAQRLKDLLIQNMY